MVFGMHRDSRLPAAGLGLALVFGGCALMEPSAERYVAPPVGTTWERMQTDTGSYGSGSAKFAARRGERMWQGAQVVTFEGAVGPLTVFARADGAWLGLFKGDTPVVTFDPPQNWQWPLEVGKTWTREQRTIIHAAKRTIPYQLTQKVEAVEHVTVPAGTFKTFKVSTVTSLGDENVVWFSPELGIFVKVSNKRTAKHPQGPGTRVVDLISYKRGG
jgi:hypothetical protein